MKRTMRAVAPVAFGVAFALASAIVGCRASSGDEPSAPAGVTVGSITVTSKSFTAGGAMPVDFTCDGKDVSPQMTWSSPPEGAKSLVVVVDDPDAPGGTFTHWLVYGIPAETMSIGEGADPGAIGARIGVNDFHSVRYAGPCPPHGDVHRYQFHVYALDGLPSLPDGADRAAVDTALHGHVIGHGMMTGTFGH